MPSCAWAGQLSALAQGPFQVSEVTDGDALCCCGGKDREGECVCLSHVAPSPCFWSSDDVIARKKTRALKLLSWGCSSEGQASLLCGCVGVMSAGDPAGPHFTLLGTLPCAPAAGWTGCVWISCALRLRCTLSGRLVRISFGVLSQSA